MNCLNPIAIRNKYTHKWMYVACGKCDGCRIEKSIDVTSRLNNELSNFNVSIFTTLTYDNYNIPFVIVGSKFVLRLSPSYDNEGISISLVARLETPFTCKSYHIINNFPLGYLSDNIQPIGVIEYSDFQKFFKRFRKNLYKEYGKTINFRHAISVEYGTFTERPHAHIVFGFSDRQIAEVAKRLLFESWLFCDRSRLQNYTVFCSKGVGSYLSSYIAGYTNSNGVSSEKRFRPRFRRSNEINYGISAEDVKTLTNVIKRNFGREIFEFSEKDFYTVRKSKSPSLSTCIIPAKVFRTYFQKCKGYGNLSFVDFCLCCYRIFRISEYKSRFGRIPEFEEELSSLDLGFFRSYRRVCFLLKIKVFDFFYFECYVKLFYQITNYYESLLLKEQMLLYEKMTPQDYLTYCYDTFPKEDISSYYVNKILVQLGLSFPNNSDFYTVEQKNKIKNLISQNKSKLLPKHYNDLIYKI